MHRFDSLPPGFNLNLNRFSKYRKVNFPFPIVKSDYRLGYIIGAFLWGGNSVIRSRRPTENRVRAKTEEDGRFYVCVSTPEVADKLADYLNQVFGFSKYIMRRRLMRSRFLVFSHNLLIARFFKEFGANEERYLPEQYLVRNKEYLRGIHDGISDVIHNRVTRPMVSSLYAEIGEYLGIDTKV